MAEVLGGKGTGTGTGTGGPSILTGGVSTGPHSPQPQPQSQPQPQYQTQYPNRSNEWLINEFGRQTLYGTSGGASVAGPAESLRQELIHRGVPFPQEWVEKYEGKLIYGWTPLGEGPAVAKTGAYVGPRFQSDLANWTGPLRTEQAVATAPPAYSVYLDPARGGYVTGPGYVGNVIKTVPTGGFPITSSMSGMGSVAVSGGKMMAATKDTSELTALGEKIWGPGKSFLITETLEVPQGKELRTWVENMGGIVTPVFPGKDEGSYMGPGSIPADRKSVV